MEVISRLRYGWRESSPLMKIVWINVSVFVALRIAAIVCIFSGNPGYIDVILSQVELPAALSELVSRPWTVLIYMFSQYDLMHVVFNMLWLYWFGTIFRMTASSRQLFVLYMSGGLVGALFFVLFSPLLSGAGSSLIGSSAAVIAIVTAVAILMPHFKMTLFLLGSVKVKWIALATIVLVLVGVTGSNAGGQLSHIGGVVAGVIFALYMRHSHSRMVNRRLDSAGQAAQPSPTVSSSALTAADRRELDTILDKIKKSGYSSLTSAERDRLFSVSRKIK